MSQPANDDYSQHLSDDEASYHKEASDSGTATNKPKQQQQQLTPTTTTISNIKLPILKKEEYDIWAMEMEHYLEYIDNDVWKVIQNGNSKKRISTGKDGVVRILPPVSPAEIHAVEKERKARTILLMAIPKEHLRRFHGMDDAKEIWEAIRTRDKRAGKKEQNQNCLLTMDDGVVNWGEHTVEEEETNHALMAISSNTEMTTLLNFYLFNQMTVKDLVEMTYWKHFSDTEQKKVEPSCAKHVKTPRQQMKNQGTSEVKGKNWNKMMERELGEENIAKGLGLRNKRGYLILVTKGGQNQTNINSVRPNINTGRTNINSVRPNINTGRTNINSVRPNINTGRVNVNSVRPNVNTGRVNVNSVRPTVNAGSSNVNTVRSRQPVPTKTLKQLYSKKTTSKKTITHDVKGIWGIAVKTLAGQTATGKESSNLFMAGSLPKTIHFYDSLQSDEDSFELIELIESYVPFSYMVLDLRIQRPLNKDKVWKVIQNGNSKSDVTKGKEWIIQGSSFKPHKEQLAMKKKGMLETLLANVFQKIISDVFHGMENRKESGIHKTRFGVLPGSASFKGSKEGRQAGKQVEVKISSHETKRKPLITIDKCPSLCSKLCLDSYNALQAKYDELQSEFGDQEAALVAHKLAVKKLESQLKASHKQQSSLNEN
ncbi:hypothetical protein Tco_0746038 [Tanacetum coccineum]